MNIFKNVLGHKKTLTLLILILVASSLFGYVLPTVFNPKNDNLSTNENFEIYSGTHPLTGVSDNVVFCSDDNSELHELYLCGADAERTLTINAPNISQIIWSKLQSTSCAISKTDCPNTSTSCTWNQVSTNTQYNVSESGEFRIFVRYTDNTSERFYFNIYANGLAPSSIVSNIDCANPGKITITNVPSSYEYSINNGATWQDSNVFTITSVSTYDVKIRNKNNADGCLFSLDNIAVNNNSFNATPTILPITCNTAKGGIKIDLTDASSNYIYEISQGGSLINSSGPITSNTYTFTDLNAGSYDITVKLSNMSSCSWNATSVLPSFEQIQPNPIVTKNIDCTDGIITLAPTGGTAPYEYSVDNGAFLPFTSGNKTDIAIPTAGSFIIKVRDTSGCEVTANSVSVINEPEITYTVTPKDITCNGADDGSVTVAITNSQGYSTSYSIDGTTFQTSNVFSNLASGSYTVTIKKEKAGGSCNVTANAVTVNPSTAFTASATVTQQINCTNGSATIEALVTAGGTSPFEYSTNGVDFQPSATITGLGAGTYTITVKDANGCTTTVDQTINGGSNPTNLTFLTSDIDCTTGATDIQISVENGTGPYTYQITSPSNITSPGDTFTALAPGTYTFEVDDNGCKIVRNYTVSEPIKFTANTTVKKQVTCFAAGTADGEIEVDITNFNTSFDVVVENSSGVDTGLGITGATTSPIIISGLQADTYTIKIKDASGPCEYIETQIIEAPTSALNLDSFSVSHMNCGSPGSVTIEASGGWGNYNYAVLQPNNTTTTAQSNKTITGLTQVGTYTIILKDINGCVVDTQTFDLEDKGGPVSEVDISTGSPTHYCYDNVNRGVLKIDVSGGEAPYFYTQNNGTPMPITGGTFTLSNLTPEDYIIKVIGGNGCETVVADTKISGQLFALAQITKPLGCGATPDAIINVTPEEGYPPYTYTVNGDPTPVTMPYNASAEGLYTFTVTDTKGCSFTTEAVDIKSSPPLDSSNNVSPTTCGKDGTGSVRLMANGGTPPYQYAFSDTPFSGTNPPVYGDQAIFPNLDATNYYFAIKDDLGCTKEDIEVLVHSEDPIIAEYEKTDVQCDPAKGGNVWGNMKVKNITNATGLVNISLIRVHDKTKYEAGDETRTWVYRRYEDIDLSTNSNYLNASKPTLYGNNPGFDIRLYWANHFVVRVEDEKGCLWESPVETVTAPTFPNGTVVGKEDPPICANGATFDFKINDDPTLVGPFEARIWPYDMIDSDGDGIEDDITNDWRPFDDIENPAYNAADPNNERDYKFTNSALYGKLLFGVNYSIIIRDKATGCIRWRSLGMVNPPSPGISVDAVPQSETCTNAKDGKLQLTINGAAAGPITYKIYNASNPKHASYQYGNFYGNGHVVTSDGVNPITFIVPEDLRVAWYVVEVEDVNGCSVGERFLIYRPKTKLQIKEEQVVQPTCNIGGQVAISAIGGWDNEKYFNIRNKLYQNWHEYEYALVLDSQTPTDADFGPNPLWTNVVPTAYDGVNNIYRAYVRDGGGCVKALADPITFTQDPEPIIDTIDVTDRCAPLSGSETYNVVATLTQPGTNPTNTDPVYIWDGEVTTTATKTLGPGNHTLVVRDENGCSDIQNIHIYPQLVAKSKITKTVDCDISGLDNGEMLASAYGGSGNFEYTIFPIPASYAPGEETNTTGIFTRLEPNVNYVYTVNDLDNTCGTQDSPALELIMPVDPQFEVDTTVPVTCFGSLDGKIIIKQIDGVDNLDVSYEYSIDSGTTYQTSNLFEGLAAGSYDVDIRSSKNCVQNLTGITVGGPTAPVTLTMPTVSSFACTTDNKLGMATIDATVSGGIAPYKYSYNSNSFSSIAGTAISFEVPYKSTSQNVILDVIDANGCKIDPITTVTVSAATKISATITTTTTTAMNCVVDGVYEINIPPSFTNFSIVEQPSASPYVTISGTTVTIERGQPNTYSFLVTDNDTGCFTNVQVNIAPFNTIEISASKVDDITCHGESNGELSFEVSGFGSGFSYDIYNVSNTSTPIYSVANSTATTPISYNLLPAGTFVVRATDNDTGCHVKSEFISIQSPAEPLDFTYATTHELTCSPGSDAQITATPQGGWGTYEFELVNADSGTTLQPFDVNNVFSDLSSGINYELTIRDANGCSNVTKTITIDPIDPIIVDPANPASITTTNPSCTKINDGEITIIATREFGNGHTNFQYILTNVTTGVSGLPQTSSTFSNLFEGDYTVTVQDGSGCDTTTGIINIIDPVEIQIDGTVTIEPGCISQGQITVSAVGGSGSYEYKIIAPTTAITAWDTKQAYTLPPGTYEFLARDSDPTKHCVSPISVIRTINKVEPLDITVNSDNTIINCNGEMDAVLVAEATDGLGGYQYQLEVNGTLQGAPQDSGIFENLGQGVYRIVATSGADCEKYSEEITINQPPLLTANLGNSTNVMCFGEDNGTIEITASGGNGPYQYIISSNPKKAVNNNTFDRLPGGTYSVIVQDANGCQVTVNNITIEAPNSALLANVTRVEDEVCSSDDNGLIEVEITGGTAPYKYNLTSPTDSFTTISGSTLTLDNLDGGFYEIYLEDANDCDFVLVQEVKVGSNLSATVETSNECSNGQPIYGASILFDDENLDTSEIVFDLDDANPNNPDVANAQAEAIFTDISSGNHTISIVHLGTGCIEVKNFSIEAQQQLVLTSKPAGINEIIVEATGGDGIYTYYFDDEVSSDGTMYINHTDVYTAKVIDSKSCEASLEIPLEFIDIEIPNFFTPDGDGFNDTWVIKNVEGFPNLWGAIYDRYGRQVKYFVKQGNWDGSYDNVDLPSGDYWYVIKLNGENDDREFVGHVTIYR
ncbi:gliding motility-associated-like protein [Maribacter vaceletii]|uniref:Gliding motility-associated-like protein n=1 Tax=Maribacter vaceletii TaxID=1206816 RepID=A0A495EEF0_9FLAO|nr:T9SS type B sorting domain-containing protein [Maribacter vaceletii]RKR15031.1 gliding motility-associated-like protein [Maribacter vaceletii]